MFSWYKPNNESSSVDDKSLSEYAKLKNYVSRFTDYQALANLIEVVIEHVKKSSSMMISGEECWVELLQYDTANAIKQADFNEFTEVINPQNLYKRSDIEGLLKQCLTNVNSLQILQADVILFYNKFEIDDKTIKKNGIKHDHFWRFILQVDRAKLLDERFFNAFMMDIKPNRNYQFVELEKIMRTLNNLAIHLQQSDLLIHILNMEQDIQQGKFVYREQTHDVLWQIRNVLEYCEKFKDELPINQDNFKLIIARVRVLSASDVNLVDALYKYRCRDVIIPWSVRAGKDLVFINAVAQKFLADFKQKVVAEVLPDERKAEAPVPADCKESLVEKHNNSPAIPVDVRLKIMLALTRYKKSIPAIMIKKQNFLRYFSVSQNDMLHPAYKLRVKLVTDLIENLSVTSITFDEIEKVVKNYRDLNLMLEHKFNSSSYAGISSCLDWIDEIVKAEIHNKPSSKNKP